MVVVAGLGSRSSLSRVRADTREGRGSAHDEGGEGDEGEEGEATGEADQGKSSLQFSTDSYRQVDLQIYQYLSER